LRQSGLGLRMQFKLAGMFAEDQESAPRINMVQPTARNLVC